LKMEPHKKKMEREGRPKDRDDRAFVEGRGKPGGEKAILPTNRKKPAIRVIARKRGGDEGISLILEKGQGVQRVESRNIKVVALILMLWVPK